MTRQDHATQELIAIRLRLAARLTPSERADVIEIERTEAWARRLARECAQSKDLPTPPTAA